MNTIDFNKNDFPLTTTVLGFMQAAYQMVELLSGIAGTRYILSGCEVVGNSVNPGIVVIDGAIMPFDGGVAGTYVRVVSTPTTVTIQDGSYTKTEKRLVFGSGSGQMAWSDVKRIDTLLTLMDSMANKVDKVAGKQLSQEDFTTALKNKLDGLSNYVHPQTHPISVMGFNALQVVVAGGVNADGTKAYNQGSVFTPSHTGTGKYRVAHNLGDVNYFVVANTTHSTPVTVGTNTIKREENYFDINTGNDDSPDNWAFEFIIIRIQNLNIPAF